jgi:hypothetical protein
MNPKANEHAKSQVKITSASVWYEQLCKSRLNTLVNVKP